MKIYSNQVEEYIKKIANEKICGCLIYGPETSLVKSRFDIIAKKIVEDLSDPFLVSQITSEKIKEDQAFLADEFYSIAMLGGRKLITIKDCDSNTTSALKSLISDGDYGIKSNNFILIQGEDLDKKSALRKLIEESKYFMAIPCYEEDSFAIKKFINETLVKNKIKPNPKFIDYLVNKFGRNRYIIENEINKSIDYLGNGQELTIETIELVSFANPEISNNNFISSFANKDYIKALIEAEKLLENKHEPMLLLKSLTNYFSKLYLAKISVEHNKKTYDEAIKSQQIFFKMEKDFRSQLKNLSIDFLIKQLQNFESLEIKLKKGIIPQRLVILSFITNLISASNSL